MLNATTNNVVNAVATRSANGGVWRDWGKGCDALPDAATSVLCPLEKNKLISSVVFQET